VFLSAVDQNTWLNYTLGSIALD